jgi:hypothetical protein
MDSYLEVCPQSGVNVRDGKVIVGPCFRTVSLVYKLNGVAPISTVSPVDGRTFFVPRVNTFRPDGQFVNFFNQGGTYTQEIRIFPCGGQNDRYGVDVFSWANQKVLIKSQPEVPLAISSEQGGSQTKYQMVFTDNADVEVTIGNADNGRDVTFTVDMTAEILAGRFGRPTLAYNDGFFGSYRDEHYVEVRGPFTEWTTNTAYRMYPSAQWRFVNGAFVSGGQFTTTIQFVGDAGTNVAYKFYAVSALRPVGWESGADRALTLGPAFTPQQVSAVFRN